MIVEDNPSDAFIIRKVIEGSGIDVEILMFDSGDKARNYLTSEELNIPHLMILDWNLIRVHGREILRLVKESDELRMIHVIVFTTSSNEFDMREALKGNANCFAVKPDSYKVLEEGLSNALGLWLDTEPFFKTPR